MSEPIKVTDDSFDTDVLKADMPVLVDFWAEWCAPCKQISPLVDELAKNMAGKLVVAKMDVDANTTTPGKYGVRGIPTLLIFKNGEVSAMKVGALPAQALNDWVTSSI